MLMAFTLYLSQSGKILNKFNLRLILNLLNSESNQIKVILTPDPTYRPNRYNYIYTFIDLKYLNSPMSGLISGWKPISLSAVMSATKFSGSKLLLSPVNRTDSFKMNFFPYADDAISQTSVTVLGMPVPTFSILNL